jgi:SNF2 family DNA or RNA helicase
MGTLEEKIAKLEEEKTALAKEVESEKSQHASAVQTSKVLEDQLKKS